MYASVVLFEGFSPHLTEMPGGDGAARWLQLVLGTYDVTWFDVDERREVPGDAIVVDAPGRADLACPVPATHLAVVHVSRTR